MSKEIKSFSLSDKAVAKIDSMVIKKNCASKSHYIELLILKDK